MKLSAEGRLRRSVYLAFAGSLVASGGLVAGVAHAQSDSDSSAEATQLQAVKVTGSLVRRVDKETSNPVLKIDRKQIEASGVATIGQLLQQLPSLSGDSYSPQVNNGSDGSGFTAISLRGLGSARTLLLLDGHRVVNNDLNQIPVALVDRVEVLNQGAGTVYGSDAIAGVINIITRKNYTGTEVTGSFGAATDHGDAQKTTATLLSGLSGKKGHAVFGISVDKNGSVKGPDRDVSKAAQIIYYGHISQLGSSRIPTGLYALGGGTSFTDASGSTCSTVTRVPGATGTTFDTNNFECRGSLPADQQSYNYQTENLVYTPSTHMSMFGNADYWLGDNIRAYFQGVYTHTKGHNQLAEEAFDTSTLTDPQGNPLGITISQYSQYNPFGADVTSFKLRATQTGPRSTHVLQGDFQGTIGVDTTLLDKYDWDNSFTYGRVDETLTSYGYLNISQLAQQLGPSKGGQCYTDGTYTTVVANCTPINFIGTTGTGYSSLSKPETEIFSQYLEQFRSVLSGDLDFIPLPAGNISGALGYEFRQTGLNDEPSALAQSFLLSEGNGAGTTGKYNVHEFFGEVLIPVAKNLPGVYSLNLDVGGRYSKYSNFGDTTNAKYALEYRPIADLMLRATYSDIFRAPTVTDLYRGNASSSPSYADPCNGYYDGGPLSGNPACAGIPQGVFTSGSPYKQANSQGSVLVGGNPNVGPETGYSTDFGFVYSASWYRPLSFSADLWYYKIKDAIASLDLATALQACSLTGSSTYCGTYTRDPSTGANAGQVISGVFGPANIGVIDTRGVDFSVGLNYPHTPYGSFRFNLDGTYLDKINTVIADGVAHYSQAGEVGGTSDFIGGGYPRLKFQAMLDWTYGAWDVVLRNRFVSTEKDDGGQDGAGNRYGVDAVYYFTGTANNCHGVPQYGIPASALVCSRDTGYVDYQDAQVSYTMKKIGTTFTVGANDIFDQGAPIAYTYGPSFNYDATNYDSTGRFVYGRVKVEFK